MRSRAIAPVVGVVMLVAVVVVLAGVLAVFAIGIDIQTAQPTVSLDGSVNESGNEITLAHTGGDPIDITRIEIELHIDEEPLEYQPDIPHFSWTGFRGAPSGPLNPSTSDTWESGQRSSFEIASSNDPTPTPDSTVTVIVRYDGARLTTLHLKA